MTLILNPTGEIEYDITDDLVAEQRQSDLSSVDDITLAAMLAASAWERMEREAMRGCL